MAERPNKAGEILDIADQVDFLAATFYIQCYDTITALVKKGRIR